MKPLPDVHATSKELDEYFKPYFTETQQAYMDAEKLEEYLEKKQENVAKRATDLKNIPNQARFFFKFQKGLSDTLKAKCVPRNQHTGDVIKTLLKAVDDHKKAILLVLKAGHLYNAQELEMRKAFYLKLFAAAYMQKNIEHSDVFEKNVRDQYKTAVEDEKKVFKLLQAYLKEKEAKEGNVPPEEYKKFKAFYEAVAAQYD